MLSSSETGLRTPIRRTVAYRVEFSAEDIVRLLPEKREALLGAAHEPAPATNKATAPPTLEAVTAALPAAAQAPIEGTRGEYALPDHPRDGHKIKLIKPILRDAFPSGLAGYTSEAIHQELLVRLQKLGRPTVDITTTKRAIGRRRQ